MKKIVIITGLTASGKSGLAIDLAKHFNGEIISADSVQIYKGLDIGSAKESKQTMDEIPHHLIDIKDFSSSYNVGEFISDCANAIKDITSRNKLPIIIGGTGLYIKALMQGYSLGGNKADLELRNKYEELAKTNGNEYVWNELNKLNSDLASKVHPNNLKRVIRYLDIAINGNKNENSKSILDNFDICAVGIVADREAIYERINKRVDEMISSGLEEEVINLVNNGANADCQSMNSIGYKEWFDYFDTKQTKQETINLIKQHTRNYCKRQLTFLKTIPNLKLLDIMSAKKIIEDFLND